MLRGRGFTLIEMVVVILLLAVVAGIIVPRLISTGEREASAEAEAVASLAGAAWRRASTTTQKVAMDYADGTLRIYTLRAQDPREFEPGNTRWAEDLLLAPVTMANLSIVAVVRDGAALNPSRWRVELGDQSRPRLAVTLEAPTGRQWTVVLSPEEQGALLLGGADAEAAGSAIDLDTTGRGLAAW